MRTALALSLFLLACGGASPADQLKTAQDQLSAGAFDKAAAASQAGLDASPDATTAWRLELTHLEALARGADVEGTHAALDKLAKAQPDKVKGTLYVSTADQLKGAGKNAGAIEILDMGLKRFPGDPDITKAIEHAKASGGTDELEALKSLGYIGD